MSWLDRLLRRKKKKREVLDFMGWDDSPVDDDDDEIEEAKKRKAKKKEYEPEHVILYIRTADHQLWGKFRSGWKLLTHPPKGHVIVMVNLAEESFNELATPRLFGRDRLSFLNRQLANRFPDTPYRAAIDGTPPGKIFEKLAPTRHILVGLEAEQRINDEIRAHDYSVRGVWTVSVLMAQYGRSLFLPEDLFIVFLGPGGQRIVFIKDRVPVLTRLTPNPYDAKLQVDEIVRTLRYLENKQLVERGTKRHSLLLLGDPTDLEEPLREARFDLVDREKWEDKFPEDWRFPLFDRVIKNPSGQLAPLSQRTHYLADRINAYAIRARYAAIVITALLIAGLLPSTIDRFEKRQDVELQIQQVAASVSQTNRSINEFGVTADLLRKALELDVKELATAPAPGDHFPLLAQVISVNPDLRLNKLTWRILASGTPACTDGESGPQLAADPNAPPSEPPQDGRKVQWSIEVWLPESYGPRQRSGTLRQISTDLSKLKGSTLLRNPLLDEAQGTLRGGPTVVADKPYAWCLTLPGAPSTVAESGPAT